MHSPSTPIHSHPTEISKLQSRGSVRFPPEPPRAVLERCRRGISPPSHSNGARPWHVSPNHSSRASDVSRPFLKSVPRSVRFPGNPPRGSSLGPVETSTQGGKAAIPGALSGFRSHRPMPPPPPAAGAPESRWKAPDDSDFVLSPQVGSVPGQGTKIRCRKVGPAESISRTAKLEGEGIFDAAGGARQTTLSETAALATPLRRRPFRGLRLSEKEAITLPFDRWS